MSTPAFARAPLLVAPRDVPIALTRRIYPLLCAVIAAAVSSPIGAIVLPLEYHDGEKISWVEDSPRHQTSSIYALYLAHQRGITSPQAVPRQLFRPTLERPILVILLENEEEPTLPTAPLFTYNFPGSPGSGLAANQNTPQPANATFSDFTRTGLNAANSTGTFSSKDWSQTATNDPSLFTSFSITAATGFELLLTQLTFDALRSSNGPQSGEVSLFLNGSSTPYATFSYSPATTTTNYIFDFADLISGQNVTSVSFNFYGWNAIGLGGQLEFDNVSTFGAIAPVPEMNPTLCAVVICLATAGALVLKRRKSSLKART